MGCNAMGAYSPQTSTDIEIISMIVSRQTGQAIRSISDMGECFNINSPINFKGDTLLHYACAKGDHQLV